MTSTSELTFRVSATGSDLYLRASLDETTIFDGMVDCSAPQIITHGFNDDLEMEHVLCFELSGKLPEHTKISESGEILEDRVIIIDNLAFDGIALGHLFNEVSRYHHNLNGNGDAVTEKFFGTMGCNGRVEMRFTTPIYLWLLENM